MLVCAIPRPCHVARMSPTPELKDLLREATELHRQGRLDEAEEAVTAGCLTEIPDTSMH